MKILNGSCRVVVAFCLLTVLLSDVAYGQIVVENSNVFLEELGMQNYGFTVQQDVAGTDPTGISFSISSSGNLTFEAAGADEGSDWYLVESGEEFSIASTSNGANDLWGTSSDPASFPNPPSNSFRLPTPGFSNPLQLTAQSEFYLAFATDQKHRFFAVAKSRRVWLGESGGFRFGATR